MCSRREEKSPAEKYASQGMDLPGVPRRDGSSIAVTKLMQRETEHRAVKADSSRKLYIVFGLLTDHETEGRLGWDCLVKVEEYPAMNGHLFG